MSVPPAVCLYCDGDGNGSAGPCGFCVGGTPLDTQEDWDQSWGRVSAFWKDLNENMKNPSFREAYLAESERIRRIDEAHNEDNP